jgi:hypothetical protein
MYGALARKKRGAGCYFLGYGVDALTLSREVAAVLLRVDRRCQVFAAWPSDRCRVVAESPRRGAF